MTPPDERRLAQPDRPCIRRSPSDARPRQPNTSGAPTRVELFTATIRATRSKLGEFRYICYFGSNRVKAGVQVLRRAARAARRFRDALAAPPESAGHDLVELRASTGGVVGKGGFLEGTPGDRLKRTSGRQSRLTPTRLARRACGTGTPSGFRGRFSSRARGRAELCRLRHRAGRPIAKVLSGARAASVRRIRRRNRADCR